MKCKAFMCETPASIRGYCAKDYNRKRRHGQFGRVDGAAARRHIKKLHDLGWTYDAIDEASGCRVAAYVARNKRSRVLPETEAKILAVPLEVRSSTVGFRRRIEALGCVGWSRENIAQLAGLSVRLVNLSPEKLAVSPDVFARLKTAYDRYKSTSGPSKLAAMRAVAAGYSPPLAWELEDIDDPRAKPYGGFARSA